MALLEDLRDVAQFVIDSFDAPFDAEFAKSVNAQLTRSASLEPGKLRTDSEIGVSTRCGRHAPPVMQYADLQRVLDEALTGDDPRESALDVFVAIARAQPFGDGNKRTALFVANALLLRSGAGVLLVIPVDEADPTVAERFNDLLARAYVFDESDAVKTLLRHSAMTPFAAGVDSPRQ